MGFFFVIMLLHMLPFGGYAFGYALFFGVTYVRKRRLHIYAIFWCLCHILCSDFGVKYALKRRLCYCCMVVSGLFTLVFGVDIVFMMHAKYTYVRMLLYTETCFETIRYRIKIGLCFG